MIALLAADGGAALPDYLDKVGRWRAGEDRPLVEMTTWSADRVQAAEEALELSRGDCDDACARAAALMHTELGFYFRRLEHHPLRQAHFRAAERLMRLVRPPAAERAHDDFERRWRLAFAYQHLHLTEFEEMLELLREAHQVWGNHPEILVARGTLHELLYIHPPPDASDRPVFTRRDTPPRRPAQELAQARGCYRQAIAKDPRLAEAHVRYGRVLRLSGQLEEAAASLERGLALGPPPEITAFAHLFLGEIAESRGRWEEAAGRYRQALEADRYLQSARFALSHALHRLDRREESAEVLRDALRATGPVDRVDTWAGYQMGAACGYRHRMALLRDQVRR